MFKQIKSLGLVAVSAALIAALLVGSVVPAKAEPGKVVKIGMGAFYTGPVATMGVPACNAFIDYMRYINEQGGINGVELEVVWYETKYLIPHVMTAYRRVVDQGAMIFGLGSPLDAAIALLPRAERDGVALNFIDALMPGAVTEPQWILVSLNDWATSFVTTMKWLKDNLWTEARPARVGMIFYDTGAGRSSLDSVKYLNQIGCEFVGYETVPLLGCIDTSTELLRLVNKKADFIYMVSYGAPSVVIIKDAARLEIQQKGVKLVASANAIDYNVLEVVGKDADGWYANKGTRCYFEAEKFPGLKLLHEVEKEYRGYEPRKTDGFGAVAWVHAAVCVEAIRLAMEDVGYENLSPRAVRDALFSGRIKDFSTGIVPPITITEDTPWLVDTCWICEIRGAEFHPISRVEPIPSLYVSPEKFEEAIERW